MNEQTPIFTKRLVVRSIVSMIVSSTTSKATTAALMNVIPFDTLPARHRLTVRIGTSIIASLVARKSTAEVQQIIDETEAQIKALREATSAVTTLEGEIDGLSDEQ